MAGINFDSKSQWERFKRLLITDSPTNFSLDISRISFDDKFLGQMEPRLKAAISFMSELENGAIANPDENRMVGHYWLRAPEKAPTAEIKSAITGTLSKIEKFCGDVHSGKIKGSTGKSFRSLLLLGIGGSALGPQFVAHALGSKNDKLKPFFIDNTDPDGIARTLSNIPSLEETIVLVISKSGSTPETRNGMLEAKAHFSKSKLDFSKHAVAVTGEGSQLDKVATSEKWLERFPMWDWVGGRTSELSAVGLLPAALQGLDIAGMLSGARQMDILTRESAPLKNPAAMLALGVYAATDGRGSKDMVVLPYRDRLELFSRYLQQLIMESLGKEKDLSGKVVHQGIAVYGNKGSTDQHAYVQQLRDGIPNFFAVFIEVLKDSVGSTLEVDPGITSSDYLHGFFLGTRKALSDNGRESITVTIPEVSAYTVGMLIALFERFVGIYAHLINVNAYHQPGVEAGKKAAADILALQKKLSVEKETDTEVLAKKLNADPEMIFKLQQRGRCR